MEEGAKDGWVATWRQWGEGIGHSVLQFVIAPPPPHPAGVAAARAVHRSSSGADPPGGPRRPSSRRRAAAALAESDEREVQLVYRTDVESHADGPGRRRVEKLGSRWCAQAPADLPDPGLDPGPTAAAAGAAVPSFRLRFRSPPRVRDFSEEEENEEEAVGEEQNDGGKKNERCNGKNFGSDDDDDCKLEGENPRGGLKKAQSAQTSAPIAGGESVLGPWMDHQPGLSTAVGSTYPRWVLPAGAAAGPQRLGDPVADKVLAAVYEGCALLVLADGCSWGFRAEAAARCAVEAVEASVVRKLQTLLSAQLGAHLLLRAMHSAHVAITAGLDDPRDAGTTTLLSALVVPLAQPPSHPAAVGGSHAFVAASVGDCKAFRWVHESGVVLEVAGGAGSALRDLSEPGGRLGPCGDAAVPDLRNLRVFFSPLCVGDLVLLVSDGVHDNLDPVVLGLPPSCCGRLETAWEAVPAAVSLSLREGYAADLLSSLISNAGADPRHVSEAIVEHCLGVTAKGRAFMEENPGKPQPASFAEYPGKMDHISVVVYHVCN
jgi:hypothetical protein